ncbi:hypothetical protein DICPUDRAFT_150653 [Dictyostelium purpureum]|uniref:Uncharacterized protein n=1 Tax=Dictyostelium purpureum TaxID=5786 RepID=F0ZGW5_DICPU|nr:uncharacterized protein DICPUDRAFT_150653 [Dictyostelium purpureum]EGC36802.1 hypothetical protein DICPUDRAFT_150653 [Dictyostelium purpureum]|eukprot:XP_003286673.1 hypothetical protein DICPUDRAFT_150653 [Dictyostelium purpureum]
MEDNDKLFFKVFRNTVIRNKIFSYIKTDSNNGTMKYNTIISLEWMVKKNLYSMIIDKIKSKQNLWVTHKSVQQLISNNEQYILEILFKRYFIQKNPDDNMVVNGIKECNPILEMDFIYESVVLDSVPVLKLFLKLISENNLLNPLLNKWYKGIVFKKKNSLLGIAIANGSFQVAEYLLTNNKLNWYNKSGIAEELITVICRKYINMSVGKNEDNQPRYEPPLLLDRFSIIHTTDFESGIETDIQNVDLKSKMVNELRGLLKELTRKYLVLKKIPKYRRGWENYQKEKLNIEFLYKYFEKVFRFVEKNLNFKLEKLVYYTSISPLFKNCSGIKIVNFCLSVICLKTCNTNLFGKVNSYFLPEKAHLFSNPLDIEYYADYLFYNNKLELFNEHFLKNSPHSLLLVQNFYNLTFVNFSIPAFYTLMTFGNTETFIVPREDFKKTCFTVYPSIKILQFFQFISRMGTNIAIPWKSIFEHLINNYPYDTINFLISNSDLIKTNFEEWSNGKRSAHLSSIFWSSNLKTGVLDERFIDLFLKYHKPSIKDHERPPYNLSKDLKIKLVNYLVKLKPSIILKNQNLSIDLLIVSLFKLKKEYSLQEIIEIYISLDKNGIKSILSSTFTSAFSVMNTPYNYFYNSGNRSMVINDNLNATLENRLFEDFILDEIFKEDSNSGYKDLILIFRTINGICDDEDDAQYYLKFSKHIDLIRYLSFNFSLFSQTSAIGNSIIIPIINRLINQVNIYDNQKESELEIISFINSLSFKLLQKNIIEFLVSCVKKNCMILFKFFLNKYFASFEELSEYYPLFKKDSDIQKIIKEYRTKISYGRNWEISRISNMLEGNNPPAQSLLSKLFYYKEFDIAINWLSRKHLLPLKLYKERVFGKLFKHVHDIDKFEYFYNVLGSKLQLFSVGSIIFLKKYHRFDIIKHFIKKSIFRLDDDTYYFLIMNCSGFPNSIKNEFLKEEKRRIIILDKVDKQPKRKNYSNYLNYLKSFLIFNGISSAAFISFYFAYKDDNERSVKCMEYHRLAKKILLDIQVVYQYPNH